MLKELIRTRRRNIDVTIFQTPVFRQKKGYQPVYQLQMEVASHDECLSQVFTIFNVLDRMPADFQGRFISTRDILFFDEGRKGQFYYQLKPGGWERINRIHIR